MLDSLLVILAFIIIISISLLVIRFLIQLSKHRTQLNQLIVGAFYCLTFGGLWESYRILYFVFTKSADVPFDEFLFVTKFSLILLSLYLIISMLFILNRQSGLEVKYDFYLRRFYFITFIAFTVLNGFLYQQTELNEAGFFTYQVHSTFSIVILAFYAPLILFIIIRGLLFLKRIKKESLRTQMRFLALIFGILGFERLVNILFYSIFSSSIGLTIDLSIIAFIAVSCFIFFFKNPNLLGEISTSFSVRSIYLIWKKGGHLIYGYDFQKEGAPDRLTLDGLDPQAPDRLLLGGLIYAISEGLEESLKTRGKLETIKIGNITLTFKYGQYVIGILFLTEKTPLAQQKLLELIERFEHHFQTDLERWMGDLTIISSDTIQNWIYKIFR